MLLYNFIKISFLPESMTDTVLISQKSLNLESTQQALNQLRNLREKRKRESPSSIYQLVRNIYSVLRGEVSRKAPLAETISSGDYLGNNRESIEDMLAFIKLKVEARQLGVPASVGDVLGAVTVPVRSAKSISREKNKNVVQLDVIPEHAPLYISARVTQLEKELKQRDEQIQNLQQEIKKSENQSKNLHIKLLNNVKRLTAQLQDRDNQLIHLRTMLVQKQSQLKDMSQLNQKKHKRIRKLEEDLYDMKMELEEKNEELEAERQCADFLEKKVGKLMQNQMSKPSAQGYEDYQQLEKQLVELAVQTEPTHSSNCPSDENNPTAAEADLEDKQSLNNSVLTESKQSKYIESIERLTAELGQAYQRINQLMKQEPSRGGLYSSPHLGENKAKAKTKSGYFDKFWK